jgi:hypothetical protein
MAAPTRQLMSRWIGFCCPASPVPADGADAAAGAGPAAAVFLGAVSFAGARVVGVLFAGARVVAVFFAAVVAAVLLAVVLRASFGALSATVPPSSID